MITNGILLILQGALAVILSPLTAINIGIDFISSIPVFISFLQVIAYLIPWSNILPIIVLNVGIIVFKIAVTLIKTVWAVIPFA